MIHPTNYPLSKQTHQRHQSYHPNPPPNNKIITSKDQAIHQLIYENTMLKKQLSELMLKTTFSSQLGKIKSVQQATASLQPYVACLGPSRGVTQNSKEFASNTLCVKGNNLADKVCQAKSQIQEKSMLQRQNKRMHHHSVGNLYYGYKDQFYQQINQAQPNIHLFVQNQNQLQNSIPLLMNQRQIKFQTNQNLANTMPSLKQQQACISEQEAYREKMIKLKGRRNSQSKRLSEEKPTKIPVFDVNPAKAINQKIKKVTQVQQSKKIDNFQSYKSSNQLIHGFQIQSKLAGVHETLKSKLNSPEFIPTLNSKANEYIPQKNSINQSCKNIILMNHEKNLNQEKKMIAKYTPKNFSQEKQNKMYMEQKKVSISCLNQHNSLKTVYTKQPETSSQQFLRQSIKPKTPAENEQKKVCLRQLRGRVYLEDQEQDGRTKRAISKSNSNTISQKNMVTLNARESNNQNTKRNYNNQAKPQMPKRMNKVELQMGDIDTESYRKLNMAEKCFPCTEKLMTKKNSHKVYLEEDDGGKHNLNTIAKNQQRNIIKHPNSDQKVKKIELENEDLEELVSIEEIHMIKDKRQIVQSSKRQQIQTQKRNPPLSRQNSIQNQMVRNKNLYNQVYCDQSKKDLHS